MHGTQASGQRDAGVAGIQVIVEQPQVRIALAQCGVGRCAIGGDRHAASPPHEHLAQCIERIGIVVHRQHVAAGQARLAGQ